MVRLSNTARGWHRRALAQPDRQVIILNGDGMFSMFRFEDGHVSYRSRYVKTERLRAELAAALAVCPVAGRAMHRVGQLSCCMTVRVQILTANR